MVAHSSGELVIPALDIEDRSFSFAAGFFPDSLSRSLRRSSRSSCAKTHWEAAKAAIAALNATRFLMFVISTVRSLV
jgi:hypothetical protein